jgi:hypothetical protein
MPELRSICALFPLALTALCGCATTQRVTALEKTPTDEVCIVENPAVRREFVMAYQRSLTQLGYRPRLLPPGSAVTDCPLTSTYVARWSWNGARADGYNLYMGYAEIRVFADGAQAGEALYDVAWGDRSREVLSQDARPKIHELTSMLFPQLAPQP